MVEYHRVVLNDDENERENVSVMSPHNCIRDVAILFIRHCYKRTQEKIESVLVI